MNAHQMEIDRREMFYKCFRLAYEGFDYDMSKAFLWFSTPNHNFGDKKPIDAISFDEGKRVFDYLQENEKYD